MSALEKLTFVPAPQVERLRQGRQIVRQQAETLTGVADRLGLEFAEAVDAILACHGRVVVTGMGKAGLIGRKIAATLSSTGTPSHFLHPAEAVHGDLGSLHQDDLVLALSHSGETEEMCRLIPSIQSRKIPLLALTGRESSTLATAANIAIAFGSLREAGEIQLAPTNSTTAMLAIGDALALVVSQLRSFTREDFALFHPGGSLGQQLQTVSEVMRRDGDLRIAEESQAVREVLINGSRPNRRTGAVIVIDSTGRLSGLFTDSDLARLLEKRADKQLDHPISEVMTVAPLTINETAMLTDAVALLSQHHISELPVVDELGKPRGLIDITDVIALLPDSALQETHHTSTHAPVSGDSRDTNLTD